MNSIVEEICERPYLALSELAKAKKIEAKDLKKGYRYIKVTPQLTVLVECDKDGNPTKRGLEHIERHKSNLGLLK